MPRFTRDPNRLNFTLEQSGKEYNLRLNQRANAIFSTLVGLLPSNYISTVQGPNYTLELKAVAVELARIELALEDVADDRSFKTTRADFLYSIAGYLLLLNGRVDTFTFDDVEFRNFLLALIRIYFQGSIPQSIQDAAALFFSGEVKVSENFLLLREGASGYDISDQFGFQIDVDTGGVFPPAVFTLDAGTRALVNVIRPAHTLFRVRYLFTDKYMPNDTLGRILDASRVVLSSYYYDDIRRYQGGVRGRDRLGAKTNRRVVGEDHSGDF